MRLVIELSPDDLWRMRHTAHLRPSSGFSDLAAAIIASAELRPDGSAQAS